MCQPGCAGAIKECEEVRGPSPEGVTHALDTTLDPIDEI